jgi:Ran GTPase-activating protein (RanGAP) involved in mRNA processing and transport
LNFVSNNLIELYGRLDQFDQHINFIYELELYYGDDTIKNLIRHSRDIRNYMKKYKEVMDLLEEQQTIDEEDDDENRETEDEKSEEKYASKQGKAIFYPGP